MVYQVKTFDGFLVDSFLTKEAADDACMKWNEYAGYLLYVVEGE